MIMVEEGANGTPPTPFVIRSESSDGASLAPGSGRARINDGPLEKYAYRHWRPEMSLARVRTRAGGSGQAANNSRDELVPGSVTRVGAAVRKELAPRSSPVRGGGAEMVRAAGEMSLAVGDCSDCWGDDVRSGKTRAEQEFGSVRSGEVLQAAGQRTESFTLANCSDLLGGAWSGKVASSSELRNLRSWFSGEAAREDEKTGGCRHGGQKRVFVVASRSLQASSSGGGVLASMAATLGEMRCRRSGTTSDGSGDSLRVDELLRHPLAIVSLVPRELSLFMAGAVAGAAAKTVTAPLDRIKLLMQVQGVQAAQAGIKSSIGFVEAIMKIGTEEGVKGYWKGNLPQVIRVIPYSAVQLFAYETYKRILKGDNAELSVGRRLAAGACAGMTSTLVTYPLDTLRLRMAVDPLSKTMGEVIVNMMKREGLASFYCGLGPSLLGIAPYIALNFCVYDLVKNSLPEEVRRRPEASLVTALASASFATAMCYPLDTVRRQLQMKGTPFKSVADAIPGIIARDGFLGLYRGFLPNALKNLPNSSIRLTTFDAAKNLISASQAEYDRVLNGRPNSSDPRIDSQSEKT